MRAERRLGEMLLDQKETVGLGQGKRTDLVPKENQVEKPTLADAGIDDIIGLIIFSEYGSDGFIVAGALPCIAIR